MARTIVDSHQHFWKVGLFDYPWMSPDLGVLYRDYMPEDLAPILERSGVERTVIVQASNSIAETRWMLDLADQNPFVAGVVGWVDLESPDVGRQLDELSARLMFKGVRHLVESEPDRDWLVRPAVVRGLRELASRDLTFDLLVHTEHLEHVSVIADECPGLRMVVDHMAKPPIASGEIAEWARRIATVAAIESIHCKLSGLVTEANHSAWTVDDLRPYVAHAIECFGPRRLIYGSDYPVCLLAATYDRVLSSFESLLDGLGDDARDLVFAGNATRFYGL